MPKYDLVFVGNGSISYVAAIEAKKAFPKLKVAMIGPKNQEYSASVAAGAMHAIFCEVEETLHQSKRDQTIFAAALKSRNRWHEFVKENNLEKVITADSTIMYKRKDGTPFETANFQAACALAQEHKCLDDVTPEEMNTFFKGKLSPDSLEAKKFTGEFAIDANELFKLCHQKLEENGIEFVYSKASKLDVTKNPCTIRLESGDSIESAKVVVAAGSESNQVLHNNLPLIPVYRAVGTAMVLDSAPENYQKMRSVVRTPNRGGAQCGLHIVPRNGSQFYLGAGNYLSNQEPSHRIETIRYLIDLCEEELYGKNVVYAAKAKMLLGSRPKSADGHPLMGPISDNNNIFLASGNYRIGLTLAPVIADQINLWLETNAIEEQYSDWAPNRKLHSYGNMEMALTYFCESRISNLIEHKLLDPSDSKAIANKRVELEEIAKKYNQDILERHHLPEDFVVDPDMYSMLQTAEQMPKELV